MSNMKTNKKTLILTSIVILLPILVGMLLWNKLPDEGWMEILQKRTREYKITDITYEFGAIVPR